MILLSTFITEHSSFNIVLLRFNDHVHKRRQTVRAVLVGDAQLEAVEPFLGDLGGPGSWPWAC